MIGSSRSRYLRASRKCCLEPAIDNSGSCWPSSAMRSVERLPKPSRLDSCLLGRQIVGSQKCVIYRGFSRSRLSGVTKWVTNGVIWPLPSPYSGLRRRVHARRGALGRSTSPPWPSVCTAYGGCDFDARLQSPLDKNWGQRHFARQADSVSAALNLGRPAGCRASFSIAAVAGGCAWSRDPVVAIERWSSVLCLLLLAVRM
jgi:hypothetical protein